MDGPVGRRWPRPWPVCDLSLTQPSPAPPSSLHRSADARPSPIVHHPMSPSILHLSVRHPAKPPPTRRSALHPSSAHLPSATPSMHRTSFAHPSRVALTSLHRPLSHPSVGGHPSPCHPCILRLSIVYPSRRPPIVHLLSTRPFSICQSSATCPSITCLSLHRHRIGCPPLLPRLSIICPAPIRPSSICRMTRPTAVHPMSVTHPNAFFSAHPPSVCLSDVWSPIHPSILCPSLRRASTCTSPSYRRSSYTSSIHLSNIRPSIRR